MVVRGCHVVRKHGAVVETGTPSDVGMTGGRKPSGESYDVYGTDVVGRGTEFSSIGR